MQHRRWWSFAGVGSLVGCSFTQTLDHLGGDGGAASSSSTGAAPATGGTSTGAGGGGGDAVAGTGGGGGTTSGPGGGGDGGAGDGGAGGPDDPCAGTPLFCTDFEDGLDLEAWSTTQEDPGATLRISTEQSVSPTHALRARVGAHDYGASYASATEEVEGSEPFRVRYQLRVEPAEWEDGDVSAGVFFIGCSVGNDVVNLAVTVSSDEAEVWSNAVPTNEWLRFPTLTPGVWAPIDLTFDPRSGCTGSVGDEPIDLSWDGPRPSDSDYCRVSVGLITFDGPLPDLLVYVDDVRIDDG